MTKPGGYNPEYYQKNKERIKAARRAWVLKNKKRLDREYDLKIENDPDFFKKQYAKNRERILNYSKINRVSINEQARLRLNDYVETEKEYSFCRDFLEHLFHLPDDDDIKQLIWYKLFSLKLTANQRQVLQYYHSGMRQVEISKLLGNNQSSVSKAMNGGRIYNKGKKNLVYGGVYNKFLKQMRADGFMFDQLAKLPEGHLALHIFNKFYENQENK